MSFIYETLEEALKKINKNELIDFILEGIKLNYIRLAEPVVGGKNLTVGFVDSVLPDINCRLKLINIIMSKTDIKDLIKWKE